MTDNSIITVFDVFKNTTNPKHVQIELVYNAIRKPNSELQNLLNTIRSEEDDKKRSALKKKLPCILFSGKFSQRGDKFLEEHSGYAVVDFDHVYNTYELKDKLKLIPYVSSAFVSPSGDGIKAVVRIPKSIEYHRENYEGVVLDLKDKLNIPESHFDKTSINESRICFASFDSDIYVNPSPSCFVIPKKKEIKFTDYNKVNIAANMIRLANDGEKHNVLLKASRLMGGYIATGMIEEHFAIQILEQEIQNRNIDDLNTAKKTIRDGVEYGKKAPIYEIEEIEGNARIEEIKVKMKAPKRGYEFLTDIEEDNHDIERYRKGGFKMGQPTGHVGLDKYFVFKEGEYNVLLGHANVGKSFFMWWLMVISAVRLDWSWIVYSTENKVRQIKKKLMEFYTQRKIEDMSEAIYKDSLNWINEHFTFIRTDRMYSATELLSFAEILIKEKEYKGFMIDPYNSLGIDKQLWGEFKGNRHEYDYAIGSLFVHFCDKNNISIFLNTHAVTEALRRKHPKARKDEYPSRYEGQPMPPESADIEGGGKFVNRVTGFFIVVHRYLYDEKDWNITKVEVKKVKDTETGGMQTRYEKPVNFKLLNMVDFREEFDDKCVIPYNQPKEEIDIFAEQKTNNFWEVSEEEAF